LHALPSPAGSLGAAGESAGPVADAIQLLAGAHRQLAELLRELPSAPAPEAGQTVPLGLFDALRRLATGEFAHAFDAVRWQVDSRAEERAAGLPPLAAEVLLYAAREAMRNAARHGRRDGAPAALNLFIQAAWNDQPPALRGLTITVEDDGAGVGNRELPPAASDDRAGAGQGLVLHSTLLAVVGGTLQLESEPGRFTRVSLFLPAEAFDSAGAGRLQP
jgi:signal transduction histidine kinase